MHEHLIGIAAALASAASWAAGAILFKPLGQRLSSSAMTLAKQLVSLLLLGGAVLLDGFSWLSASTLALLVLSGLLGIAIGDACFFEALRDLGPVAVVVLLTLGQVLTVILSVLLLGDRPSLIAWAGIALVIAGVVLVIAPKLSGEEQRSGRRGLLFGLLSVVAMSVAMVIAKPALDQTSALQATLVRMAAGAAGMLLFARTPDRVATWLAPLADVRLLAQFVIAVAVVTFGGFWLSLVAMKYTDLSVANTVASVEPVFALPLAAIVLKERITMKSLTGAVLSTAGVVLLCLTNHS